MEEKEVAEAVAEPVVEPVQEVQKTENEVAPKKKEKKKGVALIIISGLLFALTFFMTGLSIFSLFLPIGGALLSITIVFGLFIIDALASLCTIFLIWFSEDFKAWNGEVMDLAGHINDASQEIMNIIHIIVPVTLGIAALSFVATWIVTIIGLATTKRTIFKVNLIILIIITSFFALIAIASLILNFIPK